KRLSMFAGALLALVGLGPTSAEDSQPRVQQNQEAKEQAEDAWDAISGGKLLLELRPRYEYVDQSDKLNQANAFTLRTLLGWETKSYHDFSGVLQLINVT